jgi:hypothetical protein
MVSPTLFNRDIAFLLLHQFRYSVSFLFPKKTSLVCPKISLCIFTYIYQSLGFPLQWYLVSTLFFTCVSFLSISVITVNGIYQNLAPRKLKNIWFGKASSDVSV